MANNYQPYDEIKVITEWVESLERYESALHRELLETKLQQLASNNYEDGYADGYDDGAAENG
jgi:hypothetical protein